MTLEDVKAAGKRLRSNKRMSEPFSTLKNIGYLLGFMSMFMGSLSFSLKSPRFSDLSTPDIGPSWHLRPFPFPLWEIVFMVGGVLLLLSTYYMKHMVFAHVCGAIAWFFSGAVWVVYGILFRPDYVFAFGVLSLFMSAQHTVLAKLWRIEEA